ncbi:MAG: hypothetical protein WAM60_09430, partial [Candidatus Promineifilaceae bacterium]
MVAWAVNKPPHRIHGIVSLKTMAVIVSAVFALSYLVIAYQRITYPYDLDFIEEDMLMQARQDALDGPVFVPPNADYVPQVYMPFYTWLSGLMFRVTEVSFWP